MRKISAKIGVTAVFALALFALSFSHAYAVTFRVNCDRGNQTIQKALDSVPPGQPTTIFIEGVCNENVTITSNDITLQGLDPVSSQIIGVGEFDSEEESPITIYGAQRIIIDNLTVAGAESSGIVVITAVATVRNSVIENNTFSGIFVGPGAWVRIDQNTIQGNRIGIQVGQGGFGEITNNTIQNNLRDGILVRGSASAFIGLSLVNISGPNTIQFNKRDGIRLMDGATARIQDNVISSNNTDGKGFGGIGILRGASADLGGGNTISQNIGDGIGMVQGVLGVRLGFPSTTPNVIELNTNDGISASNGSSIEMSGATIQQNDGRGIDLGDNSTLRIRSSTVQNNVGVGIRLFRDSGVTFRNPAATVTGNGVFDLSCLDSESSFAGNTSGVTSIDPGCTGF